MCCCWERKLAQCSRAACRMSSWAFGRVFAQSQQMLFVMERSNTRQKMKDETHLITVSPGSRMFGRTADKSRWNLCWLDLTVRGRGVNNSPEADSQGLQRGSFQVWHCIRIRRCYFYISPVLWPRAARSLQGESHASVSVWAASGDAVSSVTHLAEAASAGISHGGLLQVTCDLFILSCTVCTWT